MFKRAGFIEMLHSEILHDNLLEVCLFCVWFLDVVFQSAILVH